MHTHVHTVPLCVYVKPLFRIFQEFAQSPCQWLWGGDLQPVGWWGSWSPENSGVSPGSGWICLQQMELPGTVRGFPRQK